MFLYEYPEDCCANDTCRSLKIYIIPLGFVSGCMLKEIKENTFLNSSSLMLFSVLGFAALPYNTYMNIRTSQNVIRKCMCNSEIRLANLVTVTILELCYDHDLISIFTTAIIHCDVRNYIKDLNFFLLVTEYVFFDLYMWLSIDFILFF